MANEMELKDEKLKQNWKHKIWCAKKNRL